MTRPAASPSPLTLINCFHFGFLIKRVESATLRMSLGGARRVLTAMNFSLVARVRFGRWPSNSLAN